MNLPKEQTRRRFLGSGIGAAFITSTGIASAAEPKDKTTNSSLKKAFIDGSTGPGWEAMSAEDFTKVNSQPDTWTWKDDVLHCTGKPVSVLRTKKEFTNFELVCEWMHLRSAGNSGIFVWTTPESIEKLTKSGKRGLPSGIEVQILDLEYGGEKKANWYTSHGDIFPCNVKMTPFAPVSPNGKRSFPSKNLSKGKGEWNHYYVRAINGEVRLWVNGEEVSGGTGCKPSKGYLALESEGSPIQFKNLRIRELP